uniref:BTB domain-containing protein n=1 Tax=Ditylenchus dipsaci TaxID=166011 RepID=A0A915CVM8_9BILA
MKADINEKLMGIDGSIQRLQASLSENKATIVKENLKFGESILKIDESILEIRALVAEKKKPIAIKEGSLHALLLKPSISTLLQANGVALGVQKRLIVQVAGCLQKRRGYSVSASLLQNGMEGEYLLHKANRVRGMGFCPFILWSQLVQDENGFLDEKGDFKMEVELSITENTAPFAPLDPQFLSSGLVESDCTLVVEDHRFPVNKGLLSAYSNYFKTLFFGEFCEKSQDEIELEEVCADEFLRLLRVIYPPFNDGDVNKKKVESLLRLADCYQMKAVLDRCSQYLKKCPISEVSLQDKLLYAQIIVFRICWSTASRNARHSMLLKNFVHLVSILF